MCFKQVIDIMELLDDANINGEKVKEFLSGFGIDHIEVFPLTGPKGKTDFIKILIPGRNGKTNGGNAPTIGILGRLGGVGARPEVIGMVSDADGAIVALASALKIGIAKKKEDAFEGDVIVTTQISSSAPVLPHKPVPFMTSHVEIKEVLKHEVVPEMDALLSIDATKGNRIIKLNGFAITPTVKNGWILRVSDDLIDIYERVTGDVVHIVPITMQDITPYGNKVYHINSIMQPWLMTDAPVVGVATTSGSIVPGCGTGSNYAISLEQATRFCVEVAKDFTRGSCKFYDEEEYKILLNRYGDMGDMLRKY